MSEFAIGFINIIDQIIRVKYIMLLKTVEINMSSKSIVNDMNNNNEVNLAGR